MEKEKSFVPGHNWKNSVDQSDPFGFLPSSANGGNLIVGEFTGMFCSSGEISSSTPQSLIMDSQISGNFPILGNGSPFPRQLGSNQITRALMSQATARKSKNGSSLDRIPTNEFNSRKRKCIPRGKAKESPSSSSLTVCNSKVSEENDASSSAKRSKQNEANMKDRNEKLNNKDNSKNSEPPKDYIHVRARRGHATDSHSLAERVRREKISERMKLLQDLVPGCNRVTGKAVMLDEIINYVQSLQRQVEFLSMKLAAINPRMNFDINTLSPTEMYQSAESLPHSLYLAPSMEPRFPLGLGYESPGKDKHSCSETQFSVNPLNIGSSCIDGFVQASSSQGQDLMLWENDLQSILQMGMGQTQLQNVHCSE